MSKFRGLLFVSALVLALGGAGCSDDSGTNPTPDQGPKPDAPKPADCTSGGCNEYVFNRILLPTTPADAQKWAVDFDGNGVKDNALGSIISALGSVSTSFEIQPTIDETVNKGDTILLLQVAAKDLVNDSATVGEAFIGKPQKCCDGKEADPVACKAAAEAGCYSGNGIFEKDPTITSNTTMGGNIAAGTINLGPASIRIKLPFSSGSSLDLNLKSARLSGKITADGITDGVLAGVISKSDLDNNVIPAVAGLLQESIAAGSTVSPDAQAQIKSLFDKDSDGTITTEEVANNELIKTFLAGDVDVDKDGKAELSLGIGFTAIKATFGTPAPTPDKGVTPDTSVDAGPPVDAAAADATP